MNHIVSVSPSKKHPREKDDFYATHPSTVIPLIILMQWYKPICIWENSCGQGHLSKALENFGHKVISTDLIYRGYGIGGVDFLKPTIFEQVYDFDAIVMNPPYKHAQSFVDLSLKRVRDGAVVAAFLNIRFLESTGRKEWFSRSGLKYVAVFSARQKCAINADFDGVGASATCYAWFVFEKGFKGEPVVKWL